MPSVKKSTPTNNDGVNGNVPEADADGFDVPDSCTNYPAKIRVNPVNPSNPWPIVDVDVSPAWTTAPDPWPLTPIFTSDQVQY